MACVGNHLAAAAISDPKKRRMYRLWFWTLTAIGVAIISGVEVTSGQSHRMELTEQKNAFNTLQTTLQRTEVQAAADMGYLKAKLEDALNRSPRVPFDLSKLGTALAKANADFIQAESKRLNNKELTDNALQVAKKMRELEFHYRQTEAQIITGPDFGAKYMALHAEEEMQFRNNLLGQAIYFRDELLRRLPPQSTTPQEEDRNLAFRGILAGPAPIADAADYLERLARRLVTP